MGALRFTPCSTGHMAQSYRALLLHSFKNKHQNKSLPCLTFSVCHSILT